MIIKSGTHDFKLDVMHLSRMLPVLHPSLPIATQLEAALTKKAEQLKARLGEGSSFELRREAWYTWKVKNITDKELTSRVVSERYNTTKIVALLHKSEKDNSYTRNNTVLDNMSTERIEVRLNGYEYPQEDLKAFWFRGSRLWKQIKKLDKGMILKVIERKTW